LVAAAAAAAPSEHDEQTSPCLISHATATTDPPRRLPSTDALIALNGVGRRLAQITSRSVDA